MWVHEDDACAPFDSPIFCFRLLSTTPLGVSSFSFVSFFFPAPPFSSPFRTLTKSAPPKQRGLLYHRHPPPLYVNPEYSFSERLNLILLLVPVSLSIA